MLGEKTLFSWAFVFRQTWKCCCCLYLVFGSNILVSVHFVTFFYSAFADFKKFTLNSQINMYHILVVRKLYFTAEDAQSCKDLIFFCQGGNCIVSSYQKTLRQENEQNVSYCFLWRITWKWIPVLLGNYLNRLQISPFCTLPRYCV